MRPSSVQRLLRHSQIFHRQSNLLQTTRQLHFTTSSRDMADKPTAAGQAISDVAQQEGGPYKGSTAAQMQSQVTKERNFEQAATEIGSKIQVEPENITSEVTTATFAECAVAYY